MKIGKYAGISVVLAMVFSLGQEMDATGGLNERV
jgi:hypothetical protein